jgi:transcriptional regulator with XRE-family HTH domain
VENLLGEFLRARRELVGPEERGLPPGARRRVPGLRREEVALLAGISVEYYVRLERGRDTHPSAQVLDALARVLDLDADSRAYLAGLALPAASGRPVLRSDREVAPEIARLLDGMPRIPAMAVDRFLRVLAYNRAAGLLYGGVPGDGDMIRDAFLNPRARQLYPDWDEVAWESVAALRASAAGARDDPELTAMVGELSLKSSDFARLWGRHDVRTKTTGHKRFNSPSVGLIEMRWETLWIASAPGQHLLTYFPLPAFQGRVDRLLTEVEPRTPVRSATQPHPNVPPERSGTRSRTS